MMTRQERSQQSSLTYLVGSFYSIQRNRIRATNQLKAAKLGKKPISGELQFIAEKWIQMEREFRRKIREEVQRDPRWEWLRAQRGIGHILGAALLGEFGYRKWARVSSLWKYCGLHVVDGRAPKLRHGELAGFNPWARVLVVHRIGESFIKSCSPWKKIYDEEKAKLHSLSKSLTPLHIHNRARRKMVKEFLKAFWENCLEKKVQEKTESRDRFGPASTDDRSKSIHPLNISSTA